MSASLDVASTFVEAPTRIHPSLDFVLLLVPSQIVPTVPFPLGNCSTTCSVFSVSSSGSLVFSISLSFPFIFSFFFSHYFPFPPHLLLSSWDSKVLRQLPKTVVGTIYTRIVPESVRLSHKTADVELVVPFPLPWSLPLPVLPS